MKPLRVAKVGGSLYDLPDLRNRLRAWIVTRADERILFVPGGGTAVDAVRQLQRTHHLDDSTAHWLAVRMMSVQAHFLGALIGTPVVPEPTRDDLAVLDAYAFLKADEDRPDSLEQSWRVTSDAIAARVADVRGAPLTLMKSVDLPMGITWFEAGAAGFVDAAFATVVPAGRPVEWVNLRQFPGHR